MEEVEIARTLRRIKNKILVFSGKGGVGKSTTSANLAVALALAGKQVGLLDIDFHGPSIPKLMGMADRRPEMDGDRLIPIPFGENLKVMSLGMLLGDDDDAVIWRGPMKNSAIKQLIKDVNWGDLDYLIVDSPPGTGDEPLSLVQIMKDLTGAIIVTQPQQLSLDDVRRSISFCEKMNLPVVGIVENMSGFVCSHCGEVEEIFKSGGGETLAKEKEIPFLGKVPIDPAIVRASDEGKPFVYHLGESPAAKVFEEMVAKVVQTVEVDLAKPEPDTDENAGDSHVIRFAMPLTNGMVADKFGRATHFVFIEYDKDANAAAKIEEQPTPENGSVPAWIVQQDVNVVIAGSMGEPAKEALKEAGVQVVTGVSMAKPLFAVSRFLKGELQAV